MNLDLVWDAAEARGDWRVDGGRLSTGHLLRSAVLISLFTDRVAEPGYRDPGGSPGEPGDRRGWWHDSYDSRPIGSRLWQLRRRKIADRGALLAEARDICREALQWLLDEGLASAVAVDVSAPPAGAGGEGTLLAFSIRVQQPGGPAPLIRALWSATGQGPAARAAAFRLDTSQLDGSDTLG